MEVIIRDFTLDLNLIGMDAYDAVRRQGFFTSEAVESMPHARNESGQLYFFKPGKYLKFFQAPKYAIAKGLQLADPHTLLAYNAANPDFAFSYPNATMWFDGNARVAQFEENWNDHFLTVCETSKLGVGIVGFKPYWWFAGFKI